MGIWDGWKVRQRPDRPHQYCHGDGVVRRADCDQDFIALAKHLEGDENKARAETGSASELVVEGVPCASMGPELGCGEDLVLGAHKYMLKSYVTEIGHVSLDAPEPNRTRSRHSGTTIASFGDI